MRDHFARQPASLRPRSFHASAEAGTVELRRTLIVDAIAAAREVLPIFESASSGDPRPREAVDGAEAWPRGEIGVGEAVDSRPGQAVAKWAAPRVRSRVDGRRHEAQKTVRPRAR
jgi:hypothetical protein